MRTKQSGFAIVELGLIVLVVVILGAVGYFAYTNFLAPKSTETAVVTAPSPSPSVQPVSVKSSSDLDTVTSQLNSVPVDDSDSSTLDNASSF